MFIFLKLSSRWKFVRPGAAVVGQHQQLTINNCYEHQPTTITTVQPNSQTKRPVIKEPQLVHFLVRVFAENSSTTFFSWVDGK